MENYLDILDRVEALELQIRKLTNIIKFHELDKIPQKYKKAFPADTEYPFFTADGFKTKLPVVTEFSSFFPEENISTGELPSKEVIEDSKIRMRAYAKAYNQGFRRHSWAEYLVDEEKRDDTPQNCHADAPLGS